jgi:RND family efflux transporter MFP subunit
VVAAWGVLRLLRQPPAVEVAETLREDVTRVLAVTGRVRPRQINQVRPLAPGRLTALPKEEGDPVRRGEVLARVDDREARSAVAQAKAAVQARREDLEQARRDLTRFESLFAEGLVPEDRVEQARLAVDRGREELRRLREAVTEAEVRLDDYVLTSPLDGRVLRRPVDPGQIVDTSTVLYEIATGDDPWVEAQVDEIYLPELTEGMAARVAAPGRRDLVWPTTVVLLGDRVDPETGSATVRLAFDGDAPDLPAGLSLDVNLTVARHPDAVTVPRAAVADLDGEPWVLTVETATEGDEGEEGAGGRSVGPVTRRRPVRVIDWPAERVVVLEGLDAGQTVVLTPQDVPEGIAVRPVRARSARDLR